jgi:hypothetical protein
MPRYSSARNERAKAGDAIRTRDIFLGKEVLYQLSYTRVKNEILILLGRIMVSSSFSTCSTEFRV